MIKYLFFILITLLSGCTTDFSGLEKLEESVYIRFSSRMDVQVDVEEVTRSASVLQEQSVGILGMATYSDEQLDTLTLAEDAPLWEWMANDRYYYKPWQETEVKDIEHIDGQQPAFPLKKGSGIVAYAYLPYCSNVAYDGDGWYIPIDLMGDSATTDWMYSGRTAKSKDEYRDDKTFKFDFQHAMARLDLVIAPEMTRLDTVRVLEIDLGVYNHGVGRMSIDDGTIKMDTATYDGKVHRLKRHKSDCLFSIYTEKVQADSFFLMPYTRIHDLRIVAQWTAPGIDTIFVYEHVIEGNEQWNSDNLHPGTRSVINVNSIKYNKTTR